jgi:hypothetical protein
MQHRFDRLGRKNAGGYTAHLADAGYDAEKNDFQKLMHACLEPEPALGTSEERLTGRLISILFNVLQIAQLFHVEHLVSTADLLFATRNRRGPQTLPHHLPLVPTAAEVALHQPGGSRRN